MFSKKGDKTSSDHRYRWLIAIAVIAAVAGWFRGSWWPRPFQALARQALAKRENDKALEWLEWATLLAPEDGETAFLRARALRRLGNFADSFSAANRGKKSQPRSERFQREEWLGLAQSGQLNKVSRHVPELLADPRGDSEEINEALLLGCFLRNRYVEANQILETWLKEHPDHARPYLFRAKLLQLKSRPLDAIDDLRKAVSLEPENVDAILELATTLQGVNEYEEAIPLFRKVIDDPKGAEHSKLGLAICVRAVGDPQPIRPLLEAAVKQAPRSAQPICELGRFELETGHYDEAINRLTEAVRLAPRDDECHFVLAQALVANGEPNKARPHFEFAQKTRQNLQELNRYEAILAKNPQDVDALVRVGSILLEISEGDEGVTKLLSALEIDPNNQAAKKRLSDHFARRGKTNVDLRKYENLYRDR